MIENLDMSVPLWKLTVGEYVRLYKALNSSTYSFDRYEYGLKGLANVLGCSRAKASQIKKSGLLDEAIYQNKHTIIIDRDKVLQILQDSKKK